MKWIAAFHGGPADGEVFELEHEPKELVPMEREIIAPDRIQVVVYLYRRTAVIPGRCLYHLSDAQAATHVPGTVAPG